MNCCGGEELRGNGLFGNQMIVCENLQDWQKTIQTEVMKI